MEEIIASRKAKAIDYEEYLKRIAELAKRVEAGQADDSPGQLNTPGRRARYNNLSHRKASGGANVLDEPAAPYGSVGQDNVLELALRIDDAVKRTRPDGWRGIQGREQVIKGVLFGVLQDTAEVERIFLIIKAQKEY
jgi:type I restriction enzyme, R subunit